MNNWYVIMVSVSNVLFATFNLVINIKLSLQEGFASGSAGPAIRIYFMLFFAVTLVSCFSQ